MEKYWSPYHKIKCCIKCGSSKSEHQAFKVCRACYDKARYATPKFHKAQDERMRDWRKRNPEAWNVINRKAHKKYLQSPKWKAYLKKAYLRKKMKRERK